MKTAWKKLKKASKYFNSYETIPTLIDENVDVLNPINYYFRKDSYFRNLEFDQNGVVLWWNNEIKKFDYHLTVLSDFSIFCLYKVQKSNIQSKYFEYLNNQVNYLINNQIKNGDSKGGWMTNLPQYFSLTKAPYLNASAISRCISVLLRYSIITGKSEYKNAAKEALCVYLKKTTNGGLISSLPNGCDWYEAYPNCSGCHVINGHCMSIIGLYDLHILSGSEEAKTLFDNGIESLLKSFYLFDTGSWILYGLNGYSKHSMSIGYLLSLIDFFKLFYLITQNNEFLKLNKSLVRYLKNPINRYSALINKSLWRIQMPRVK